MPSSEADSDSDVSIPGVVRGIVALAMLIALAALVALTIDTLHGQPDASAIQIMQVYAESIFYGLVIVGAGVAGYILSRAFGD